MYPTLTLPLSRVDSAITCSKQPTTLPHTPRAALCVLLGEYAFACKSWTYARVNTLITSALAHTITRMRIISQPSKWACSSHSRSMTQSTSASSAFVRRSQLGIRPASIGSCCTISSAATIAVPSPHTSRSSPTECTAPYRVILRGWPPTTHRSPRRARRSSTITRRSCPNATSPPEAPSPRQLPPSPPSRRRRLPRLLLLLRAA